MSESALLRAVRDQIRLSAGFTDAEVNVELEETAPATVGDLYVIVWPGGQQAGPTHHTNHGASDKLYWVNVSIAMRAPRVVTDRKREMLIRLAGSMEIHQANVEAKVDFQYPVNTAANAYILAESSSSEGFIEPLKFVDAGPMRPAPAELFSGHAGEPVAAVIRTIRFRGARRIVTRS